MAIVMWVLAGSAPENGSKVDTSQDEASKEEAKFKTAEVENREEKSGDTEKEIPNLEVEVCWAFNLIFNPVEFNLKWNQNCWKKEREIREGDLLTVTCNMRLL